MGSNENIVDVLEEMKTIENKVADSLVKTGRKQLIHLLKH